jgi:hypothetical protein
MGTANHKNMIFVRGIGRTNEAAGLIVLSSSSAQNNTWFPHANCASVAPRVDAHQLPPCDNSWQPENLRLDDCTLSADAKRLGSIVGDMVRTRQLHARLACVMRVDNRASVAYAAVSTSARTPRPPRVAYAAAFCRPRLHGKKR